MDHLEMCHPHSPHRYMWSNTYRSRSCTLKLAELLSQNSVVKSIRITPLYYLPCTVLSTWFHTMLPFGEIPGSRSHTRRALYAWMVSQAKCIAVEHGLNLGGKLWSCTTYCTTFLDFHKLETPRSSRAKKRGNWRWWDGFGSELCFLWQIWASWNSSE